MTNGEENIRDQAAQGAGGTPNAAPGEGARPAGYCRTCGRPLAESEVRMRDGVIYCEAHAPAATPPPRTEWEAPIYAGPGTSPGLAFVLGLIPGVGAIYNGQYAKGLIHVVIFGLIISILEAGAGGLEPLFGMLLATWIFYMAFEAYHTAKRRQAGLPVDEFSSLIPLKEGAGSLAGPIVLIGLGVFFLLLTLDVIDLYQVVRFWPVLLIVLGVWMLISRRGAEDSKGGTQS